MSWFVLRFYFPLKWLFTDSPLNKIKLDLLVKVSPSNSCSEIYLKFIIPSLLSNLFNIIWYSSISDLSSSSSLFSDSPFIILITSFSFEVLDKDKSLSSLLFLFSELTDFLFQSYSEFNFYGCEGESHSKY